MKKTDCKKKENIYCAELRNDSITFRVSKELKQRIQLLSKKAKRKMSDYIFTVIEEHCDNAEKKSS